jgi:hypothetical protein
MKGRKKEEQGKKGRRGRAREGEGKKEGRITNLTPKNRHGQNCDRASTRRC